MKTLVGINNLTSIDQLAYANHMQFFFNLGKKNPSDQFILCNPRRMSIDRMRNFCAMVALEHNLDYLMFIDDDVTIPVDTWNLFHNRMQSGQADIIGGVTLIRGYPYHPMIFNFKDEENHYMDDYMLRIEDDGLIPCDALGFSCVMMKMDVLKNMTPPYFITGEKHTEDVYFCQKAFRQIPDVKIRIHPMVETGHILGSEIIAPDSRDARLVYEESINPDLKDQVKASKKKAETRADHTLDYYQEMGIPLDA